MARIGLIDYGSGNFSSVNHLVVDAGWIHKWLDAGIQVLDLVSIKDVDRHTEKYEGLYW